MTTVVLLSNFIFIDFFHIVSFPGVVNSTSQNALETRNLALMSTFVVQGTCTGVVFAIGDKTIMGRIIGMSGETKFKMTTIRKYVRP